MNEWNSSLGGKKTKYKCKNQQQMYSVLYASTTLLTILNGYIKFKKQHRHN